MEDQTTIQSNINSVHQTIEMRLMSLSSMQITLTIEILVNNQFSNEERLEHELSQQKFDVSYCVEQQHSVRHLDTVVICKD